MMNETAMTCTWRSIVLHLCEHAAETVRAAIMVGIGLQIMLYPAEYRALGLMIQYASFDTLGWLFITVGVVRLATILANGHWPHYGPWMRSLGALVDCKEAMLSCRIALELLRSEGRQGRSR